MSRKTSDGALPPSAADIIRNARTPEDAMIELQHAFPGRAREACEEGLQEIKSGTERKLASLRHLIRVMERGNPQDDESIEDILCRLSVGGDEEAQALLLDDTMKGAVFAVAAERDPMWSRDETGQYRCRPGALLDTPGKVVAAFRQNNPEEAEKIALDAVRAAVERHPEWGEALAIRRIGKMAGEMFQQLNRLADILAPLVNEGLEGDALLAALLRQWPDVPLEILTTPVLPAPRQADDPPQVERRLRRYDGLDEAVAALRRRQTDADRADDVPMLDVVRDGAARGHMRCARILAQVG